MKCVACGAQIKDCDSKFCDNCGAKKINREEESGAMADIDKNSNDYSNSKEYGSDKNRSKSLIVFIIVVLILIIASAAGLVYYLKSHAL